MRQRFLDIKILKELAKQEVEKGLGKLKNWWSKKYNLPWNHELFLSRNIGSLNIEMYSDLYIKREELEKELNNADSRIVNSIVKQINEIDFLLEEESCTTIDPLIDKWEKELEEGKIPDLDEI